MDKYADFISQIPSEFMQKVERRLCSDIALFKPDRYIDGVEMHSSDYHIIIPTVPPPDTYINNRLHHFDKGKIVVFNPGDSIRCARAQETKPYLNLLIKPELMNRIAAEMDLAEPLRFLNSQHLFSKDLLHAVDAFDREAQRSDTFNLMLDCMGVQIAALVIREFKTNVRKYLTQSPDTQSYIDIAVEYIREYYSANITIDDICREINISPFHFIRVFKEKTGYSPHQYLLNVRIEKAIELLRSRKHTVSETARLCGFINLAHFSKTFKDMTGLTPKDYQKVC